MTPRRSNALLPLAATDFETEDAGFLSQQLVTCIGNKRALLGPIGGAVRRVRERLGGRRLSVLDAFSGSGGVSRLFKSQASRLVSNDLEAFAAAVGRSHLRNRSEVDERAVGIGVAMLNRAVDRGEGGPGFLAEMYAPRDDERIARGERVFYTRRNAQRLDAYRLLLDRETCEVRELLLGPLIAAASVHANTSGVFKGFYKDRRTGVGRFGGTGGDALSRIKGEIRLEAPVLSRFECEVEVHQRDANELVRELRGLDLAYFDPPYNQHPYGSNYFMLNLLVDYRRPERASRVSGIPVNWRRSAYNVRARALERLRDLLEGTDAAFLLVSFNSEGFVRPEELRGVLRTAGRVEEFETRYNTFRGSRNLRGRGLHVTEHLFLVERG